MLILSKFFENMELFLLLKQMFLSWLLVIILKIIFLEEEKTHGTEADLLEVLQEDVLDLSLLIVPRLALGQMLGEV